MVNNSHIKEYAKACLFPTSGIENNFMVFDNTCGSTVPFILYPRQRDLITAYDNNKFNIVLKSRQAGVTSVTAAYLADKAAFSNPSEPEIILIISPNLSQAKNILSSVKDFINQIPKAHWGPNYSGINADKSIFIKNTVTEFKLPNGSIIKANGGSMDNLRGYAPTYVYMDEAAYIDTGDIIFGLLVCSLGVKGKMTLASTPNGKDKFFHKIYDRALNGDTNFNIIEMKWYMDTRRNSDLKWIKNKVVVDERYFTLESYNQMIQDGWKPTSAWYNAMKNGMNNNLNYIAQELDCSFEKW